MIGSTTPAGVFSMDGHIAPLAEICALARQHNALVMVDECHATGFVGATGRGTDEQCGVLGQVDIINSTLGKAMGGATDTGPMPTKVRPCNQKIILISACTEDDDPMGMCRVWSKQRRASADMLLHSFWQALRLDRPCMDVLCITFLFLTNWGVSHCSVPARQWLKPVLLFACARGYTTGKREVVEMLRQKARPYLFSNTLAPPVAAASIEAFNMLEESSQLRDRLEENTLYFRAAMTEVRIAFSCMKLSRLHHAVAFMWQVLVLLSICYFCRH